MTYHIYINNTCVRACLEEDEFKKEWQYLTAFLELTNQSKDAKLEFVECEVPNYSEASF